MLFVIHADVAASYTGVCIAWASFSVLFQSRRRVGRENMERAIYSYLICMPYAVWQSSTYIQVWSRYVMSSLYCVRSCVHQQVLVYSVASFPICPYT